MVTKRGPQEIENCTFEIFGGFEFGRVGGQRPVAFRIRHAENARWVEGRWRKALFRDS